jgi:hypothetical protein
VFENRLNQADVRLSKGFQVGRYRFRANADLYNVFNASTILAESFTLGPTYLKPSSILGARLFKIGGQFDF